MIAFYRTQEIQSFIDCFVAAAPKNKGLFVYLFHSELINSPAVVWALQAYALNEPAHFIQDFGGAVYDRLKGLQFTDQNGKVLRPTEGQEPYIFGVMN